DFKEHQKDLTAEAMKLVYPYAKQLEDIQQMSVKLQQIREEKEKELKTLKQIGASEEQLKATRASLLSIAIAERENENQKLHIMVEQSLQLGRASDGVRAFFLEMRTQAEKASEIVYHALNSALDRVSSNL